MKTYSLIVKDKRVHLYIEVIKLGSRRDSGVKFTVISGGWNGTLSADGKIFVENNKEPDGEGYKLVVLRTDKRLGNYNEVIEWADNELSVQAL